MTIEQMVKFVVYDHPITYNSVRVDFVDGTHKIGFFIVKESELDGVNKWRFVQNNDSAKYAETNSMEHSIIIDGDNIIRLTIL